MVDHVIGIDLQIGAVRGGDQALQLFARAEPGRDRTFLVELAEVEKIIRVVTHRGIAGGLVRGGSHSAVNPAAASLGTSASTCFHHWNGLPSIAGQSQ